MSSATPEVRRFVGVYDADHTWRGEVAYWIGARLGRSHCALCDITHGAFRERTAWRECRSAMPVPFDTFHRDDQPAAVRAAAGGRAPVVTAELSDGTIHVLVDGDAIAACRGSAEALADALADAVNSRGWRWA